MTVSRDRLAPGQSRVSTASAFGRIGFLLAAAVLTIPRAPGVASEAPARVAPVEIVTTPSPHRLACLVIDPKSARCESRNADNSARSG